MLRFREEETREDEVDLEDTAEFEPVKADFEKTVRIDRAAVRDEYAEKVARIDFGDLQFGKDYEIN